MTVWRKIDTAYLESRIDGETLLITMDEGRILSLEGTARSVWEHLDGTRSESELAARMQEGFDGERAQIEADVKRFCHELADAGLVATV